MTTDRPERVAMGRTVAWAAAERWGSRLVAMVVFVILARNVAPDLFGVVALAGVYLTFTGVLVDLGLAEAIVQRASIDEEHLRSAHWAAVAIGVVASGLLWAGADALAALGGEERLAGVIRWMSFVPLIQAATIVPDALLTRRMEYRSLAFRGLLASLAGGAVALTLVAYDHDLAALVTQTVVGLLATSVGAFVAARWWPRLRFTWHSLRQLTRFGRAILIRNLLSFVNRRSDDYIVGRVLGAQALGFYDQGYRFFFMGTELLLLPPSDVSLPAFAASNRDDLPARFLTTVRVTALVAWPAFVGLSLVAGELIPVLIGSTWEPAVPVLRIVALVGVIHAMTFFNHTAMSALGKPGWSLAVIATYAVLNVTGFVIAVQFGIAAVAAAYAIRAAIVAPFEIAAAGRLVGFSGGAYLRNLRDPAAAVLVMTAAVLGVAQLTGAWSDLGRLLAMSVTGVAAYGLSLGVLSPASLANAVRALRRK